MTALALGVSASLFASPLQAAAAQTPTAVCAEADSLKRKACLARALEEADGALNEARRQVRDGLSDPRARTALDTARGTWRSWREAECLFRAAARPEDDAGSAQLVCAIDLARARTQHFYALAAAAPAPSPDAAETDEDAAASAAPNVAEVSVHRDWRRVCESGACRVETEAANGAVLRMTPDGLVWRVALDTTGAQARAHDDHEVAVKVDTSAALRFSPPDAAIANAGVVTLAGEPTSNQMVDQLRAGLNAVVFYRDVDGTSQSVTFSLRGVTAAMNGA